jgi:hypothetical protein
MTQLTLLMCRRTLGRHPLVLAALLAGLGLLLLSPAGVYAASFTVDTTDDIDALWDKHKEGHCVPDGGMSAEKGLCTLRSAIWASNANGQENVIHLPATGSAFPYHVANQTKYHLGQLPSITGKLRIEGGGAQPTSTVIVSDIPGLDHGVGHFVEMMSQKGLQQGRVLAIFSHDIHV